MHKYTVTNFYKSTEHILSIHSDLLWNMSGTDRILAASGVAAYIQVVLVPEIGSHLIQADMKVSLEDARQILRDSANIGELINDDPEEVMG